MHLVYVLYCLYVSVTLFVAPITLPRVNDDQYEDKPVKTIVGYAPHYGIGTMERVAHNRELPIVNCMVSSPYETIGTWVSVHSDKYNITKRCRVTDVSAPKDKARHIKKHWAVELDWKSAKELCNLRYVGEKPPKACPVTVITLGR